MGNYKRDVKNKQGVITKHIGDPKKGFIINLNNFRNANTFHRTAADMNFRHFIESNNTFDKYDRIGLVYTLFIKSKRSKDVMNVISILDKFFSDTLTEIGVIPDDDYHHLPIVVGMYGGMRKDMEEHVEVSIVNLDDATSQEVADTMAILIRDSLFTQEIIDE